jgi:quinol monooxygenase YgiN
MPTTERIVIATYRPKPGKAAELRALMPTHIAILREQGLVSDRAPITMHTDDGTFIEVFGWASAAAIDSAHTNPAVLAMWGRFGEVCDYVPVATVAEAAAMFPQFTPFE